MEPIELSTNETPIIFIHYGNSAYLSYVFKCARLYNPKKKIILLGDSTNQHYARKGILHYPFADYMLSSLTNQFQKAFFILNEDSFRMKGKDDFYVKGKPGHFWQRFNWLRYFILYEFWKAHGLKALWTFDSDNMIVQDLEKIEPQLSGYDFCELHNRTSMQGLLTNPAALGDFCKSMVNIFSNQPFLEKVRQQLIGSPPGYTFTEMTVFQDFSKNTTYSCLDGCLPFKHTVFDAALPLEQGFEMHGYNNPTLGTAKRIFFNQGNFYFKEKVTGDMIHVLNIDCSWVPYYAFRTIFQVASKAYGHKECREIRFSESTLDRINRSLNFYYRKLKGRMFLGLK